MISRAVTYFNPFFYFKRWRLRRLRMSIRGHYRLKKQNRLSMVSESRQIYLNWVSRKPKLERFILFGDLISADTLRQSLSQSMYSRFGTHFIGEAVLVAHGRIGRSDASPVVAPLPPIARERMAERGIAVADRGSAALWTCFALFSWVHGSLELISAIASARLHPHREIANASFLYRVAIENLPPKDSNIAPAYDFCSWLRRTIVPSSGPILHTVKGYIPDDTPLHFRHHEIPPLRGMRTIVTFVAWGFLASIFAFFCCFTKEKVGAILFRESILAAKCRLSGDHAFPARYIFSTSNIAVRPLWTHVAEQRGIEILMVQYSTNMEGFLREDGTHLWEVVISDWTWPKVYVWDRYQKEYMKEHIRTESEYRIVGSVGFTDSSSIVHPQERPSIAYFDVQPQRHSKYVRLGFPFDYYIPKYSIQSLQHLINLSFNFDFLIFYKRKRDIGGDLHPDFANFLKSVSDCPNLIQVDPVTSAHRVIEQSKAVVSIPWTSTALIGREQKKPNCYFDTTSLLWRDDPGAHGIQVASGPRELEDWIRKALR